MGILIRSGTIVTALDTWVGDILCQDGSIVALGAKLEAGANDAVIDAGGQYVFPGGLDPHVHMELPFMGTISADDVRTLYRWGTDDAESLQAKDAILARISAAEEAATTAEESTPEDPGSATEDTQAEED